MNFENVTDLRIQIESISGQIQEMHLHHINPNQDIIDQNLLIYDEDDASRDMKAKFEDDFEDIDANQDGFITIGELADYQVHIGHYDPKRAIEFDLDNKCMVKKMNNFSVGGNNDSYVELDEFLSYLALRKEYWASDNQTKHD